MSLKSNILQLFKTLRFRLTLAYSLILFIFCALFVLALNLYLSDYLHRDPSNFSRGQYDVPTTVVLYQNQMPIAFTDLTETERARIRNIRLHDLQNVQNTSIFALFPLALLSFAIGYIVAGQFLEPLKQLKKEFDYPDITNLGKQIPVYEDDEIGGLISSYNDMSLRLKRSFDSQTQFVQDASHELRTPLTVIKTNLDTVMDDENASKKDMEGAITNALKGIDDMKKLSDNLLELSLPQKVKREKTELNEFLKIQTDLMNGIAEKSGVKLEYIKSKKPTFSMIDKSSFGRAIDNLLDNAIKYSKEIEDPKVVVSLKAEGKKNIITIKDNGIGIPKEQIGRIFERFYRTDKSRNRKTGGFGLGLSIVKMIVEEHSGKISVESIPGETKFTIMI
jgi:signal transduction histidine kinase